MLESYSCPQSLIDMISITNSTTFLKELSKYYREIYDSDQIKNRIKKVRGLRNKYVAHNDVIQINGHLELNTVRELLKFATEIIDIFSYILFNTRWIINGKSIISERAEKESRFIKLATDKLINI